VDSAVAGRGFYRRYKLAWTPNPFLPLPKGRNRTDPKLSFDSLELVAAETVSIAFKVYWAKATFQFCNYRPINGTAMNFDTISGWVFIHCRLTLVNG
jgi:hypothetical protein